MNFALWSTITHGGSGGQLEHATCFIVDIPKGTTEDEVKARLLRKLLALPAGGRIEETDGLGFEEKWPDEIARQFKANLSPGKRWPWSSLN